MVSPWSPVRTGQPGPRSKFGCSWVNLVEQCAPHHMALPVAQPTRNLTLLSPPFLHGQVSIYRSGTEGRSHYLQLAAAGAAVDC